MTTANSASRRDFLRQARFGVLVPEVREAWLEYESRFPHMSSVAHRRPVSLSVLSTGFVLLWLVLAAFPYIWTVWGSFKVEADFFSRETWQNAIFGVRTVQRVIRARRFHAISLGDLKRLRVSLPKVMPFIVTSDHRPVRLLERADLAQRMRGPATQLGLFA